MRCLYCNKKLSLLKLAKGDSFCSPQHFDAHQLQLSKDAFERLMSQADANEDAPKAPLVARRTEEAPVSNEPEQNAAMARLGSLAPPPPKAAPPPVPPYAPFAVSLLPACSLDPASPAVNGTDSSEAVEGPRELAFPVHGVEATVCILNLYLRLSLADTEPSDWTSTPHLVVTAEDFGGEIRRPTVGFLPEFSIPEGSIEECTQVEKAPPIEAVRPVDAAPLPAPVVEALPLGNAAPSIWPVMPTKQGSIWSVAIAESRMPFQIAPSFLARPGEQIFVPGDATSVANVLPLAPILDQGALRRLASCDAIPKSTRFSQSTAFHAQDSTAHRIRSATELPIEPAFVRPDPKAQIHRDAWQPSDRSMVTAAPALEFSWAPTRSAGFDLPAPESLMARPDAGRLAKADPQTLLARTSLDVGSLFHGVLETPPQGQQPVFVDPPANAMECGWRATLAPFPARKPVSAAWEYRMSYFSLPDPMAAGSQSAMLPLDPLEYATGCIKIGGREPAGLPAPYLASNAYRAAAWPQSDFAAAPLLAETGLVFIGLTTLPEASGVPPGSLKTGSGAPTLEWQPCFPVAPAPAPTKFLPIRDGAVLPAAKSWPRLEPLVR
jgi:hypothetical protein